MEAKSNSMAVCVLFADVIVNSESPNQKMQSKDKCNFALTVNFDEDKHRFFVYKNSSHNWAHHGHLYRSEEIMNQRKNNFAAERLDVKRKLLSSHCPISMTQQFLKLTTGCALSESSIKQLRKTVLMRKYGSNGGIVLFYNESYFLCSFFY